MGNYTRVFPPHVEETVFVNVVDETLVRWDVHFENFAHELLDTQCLQEHHRRIMATEVDWSPVCSARLHVHNPAIAASVVCDREAVRQKVELKVITQTSAGEIDLFERAFNT